MITLIVIGARACPFSLAHTIRNEHDPLLMLTPGHPAFVVCRAAKVGSQLLRAVSASCSTGKPFTSLSNSEQHRQQRLATQQQLLSNSSRRIAFVRHPVARIISGFAQITIREKPTLWTVEDALSGHASRAPATWAAAWSSFVDFLELSYDASCANANEFDTDPRLQHVLPPQHCRCGLECGIAFDIFRVEEEDITAVLRRFLPASVLPPPGKQMVHTNQYNVTSFASPRSLALLARLTQRERTYLGYADGATFDHGAWPGHAQPSDDRTG